VLGGPNGGPNTFTRAGACDSQPPAMTACCGTSMRRPHATRRPPWVAEVGSPRSRSWLSLWVQAGDPEAADLRPFLHPFPLSPCPAVGCQLGSSSVSAHLPSRGPEDKRVRGAGWPAYLAEDGCSAVDQAASVSAA
jgi:hypothetical protein